MRGASFCLTSGPSGLTNSRRCRMRSISWFRIPTTTTTIRPSADTSPGIEHVREPSRAATVRERSRWLIPPTDPQAIRNLASELGVQPVTASVLVSRGLTDPDAACRFLTPDLGHLHDPLLLTGMR